jgi:antitoxin MazE
VVNVDVDLGGSHAAVHLRLSARLRLQLSTAKTDIRGPRAVMIINGFDCPGHHRNGEDGHGLTGFDRRLCVWLLGGVRNLRNQSSECKKQQDCGFHISSIDLDEELARSGPLCDQVLRHPSGPGTIYLMIYNGYVYLMQLAKWGNSLAVRLPSAVVEALALKEGDRIEIRVAGSRAFEIDRDRTVERALARIRELRRPLPAGFKFDRREVDERQ